MPTPLEALLGAIALDHIGSQRALAAQLAALVGTEFDEANISQWLRTLRSAGERSKRAVPEKWCEPIEVLTDGKIRVEELRPDILWQRHPDGQVIGVIKPIKPTRPTKRSRRKA